MCSGSCTKCALCVVVCAAHSWVLANSNFRWISRNLLGFVLPVTKEKVTTPSFSFFVDKIGHIEQETCLIDCESGSQIRRIPGSSLVVCLAWPPTPLLEVIVCLESLLRKRSPTSSLLSAHLTTYTSHSL